MPLKFPSKVIRSHAFVYLQEKLMCPTRGRDGYLYFLFRSKYYKYHIVIWELHNGPVPKGMIVDHINNVRTDNRIENLRLATPTENGRNKLKTKKKTSSKYKGVHKVETVSKGDRWVASYTLSGKTHHIGTYDTEEEAHEAYMAHTEPLFGEFFNDGKRVKCPSC